MIADVRVTQLHRNEGAPPIDARHVLPVVPTEGTYEFVYPTVVGPRYSREPAAGPEAVADNRVASPYLHAGEASRERCDRHARIAAGMPAAISGAVELLQEELPEAQRERPQPV